jgi:2-amino-4-hydroxy-6-hydroxymethyldihydropteridine diphosphokinase/dihydropteroate synthase
LPEGALSPSLPNHAFIALGSNIGDRFRAIEDACISIDEDDDMQIVETSPLYETAPMYVEDQGNFLNGVCKVCQSGRSGFQAPDADARTQIQTKLPPMDLLDRLQSIENTLGRVKLIDKGPRNIDLDILTYNNDSISSSRLTVPHALMLEREFVLRPLCE